MGIEFKMNKKLLLLPILLLLVSCSNEKKNCAKHVSEQITTVEAAKRLGVKLDPKDKDYYSWKRVDNYCDYYRN